MSLLRLAYVQRFRDRHGRERFYYRRKGYRIALPGRPGEQAFMEAYAAAADGFGGRAVIKSLAGKAGTIDALAVAYYQSTDFLGLRASTQATYRGIIDRFRATVVDGRAHGADRVAKIERKHVQSIVAAKHKESGPWAANNLLSLLKLLLRFAVENDWRRDDPTIGVRPIRAKSPGFATWSEEDIAAYEAKWPKGTRERLALALLLYTGQRRGDVVRMGRQHVSADTIRVVQGKTGAALTIPLHAELASVIAETPKDNLTFLTTKHGAAFTAAGFGNAFREWCDDAGLKGLSAHGLRKAAARRLAEAGCSASQIAAITGHKTLREVSRYTAAADQERMARDAMGRLKHK